jgi:hypothetical protein
MHRQRLVYVDLGAYPFLNEILAALKFDRLYRGEPNFMIVRTPIWVAMIASAALCGTVARADSPHVLPSLTLDTYNARNLLSDNRWNAQPTHRSFQWDQKGHWSLKLDMNQPVGRDIQLGDVQAGAFYRLTPSLRVGGAVALGDSTSVQPVTPAAPPPNQAPRVRLETNFKF